MKFVLDGIMGSQKNAIFWSVPPIMMVYNLGAQRTRRTRGNMQITRNFTVEELLGLGLPTDCKNGKVLEDRHLDTDEVGDETHVVVFSSGGLWGVPYLRDPKGKIHFESSSKDSNLVEGMRFEYNRNGKLVPAKADDEAVKLMLACQGSIPRMAN